MVRGKYIGVKNGLCQDLCSNITAIDFNSKINNKRHRALLFDNI
jgi:hypothetical protein